MRVLFRADASIAIGTGHVVRCATLADALKKEGAEVAFACRALPGNLLEWLSQKGFTTFALSGEQADALDSPHIEEAAHETRAVIKKWTQNETIDWLVVDHYGLDARWESLMRGECRHILTLDDLFNRPHDCDLLLDQNLIDTPGSHSRSSYPSSYHDLIPGNCRQLLGPRFALLRPEFLQARATKKAQNDCTSTTENQIPRLLIFFGGSDPTRECFKALDALQLLPPDCPVQAELIAGASNPAVADLQTRCQNPPQNLSEITLHRQVPAMADLMSRADLSIGAGGTTTWERFCLGLPGIVIAVADNQVEISRNLAEQGAHIYLGESREVTAEQLSHAIRELLQNPARRQALSEKAMTLVDGLGVTRVLEKLHSFG